ncbi:MAG: beta-lactamase family protein [Planctomycetales bacterium]|nr:beta-lactamase family protein [Planctomycetales bacterium]
MRVRIGKEWDAETTNSRDILAITMDMMVTRIRIVYPPNRRLSNWPINLCWIFRRTGSNLQWLSAVLLLASLASTTWAQSLDPALKVVEQAVHDGRIPGATVLIMQHGKVVVQRSFGVCNIDSQREFAADTICWIASLTKPVTVTAAMKLVESGKLQLDAPVANYIPELGQLRTGDGTKQPVTIRQLMSHSSGIPASVPLRDSYFFTQQWYDHSLDQVVQQIATRPLDFKPGTQVHYSNAAPYVLGRIVEVVAERPFGQFVQQEILQPLEMLDTGFSVPPAKIPRTAVVYRRELERLKVYCRYDPQWNVQMTMPDGGLFSTPSDIAKFANAFLESSAGVLSEESVTAMLTKQNEMYGLGWILDKEDQFSHWGSSGTLVWADRRTGVVGVFFSQLQDFALLAELREQFRSAVDAAFASRL